MPRKIFIRTRAYYRKLGKLYSLVRRRLRDAGVNLQANVDHTSSVMRVRSRCCAHQVRRRSSAICWGIAASTAPYLKLATEDLRAIALDVPGAEVLA
ncbi:hypothetical protein NKG95_22910 [Mesorhizobium sp. M1423]|uniref:hypothetical protein n=1 Tax=Mesorhizobium sp. M1423 TaxID=2957101 RepID=UPI0033360C96